MNKRPASVKPTIKAIFQANRFMVVSPHPPNLFQSLVMNAQELSKRIGDRPIPIREQIAPAAFAGGRAVQPTSGARSDPFSEDESITRAMLARVNASLTPRSS